MKTQILSLVMAGCSAIAFAQDKISVPLSNPSQPVTLKVNLMMGSINVTAGAGSQVTVESTDSQRRNRPVPPPPPGMHRIDGVSGGLEVEEDHNVVTIANRSMPASSDLSITVPVNTSVQLKSMAGGHIDVTGLNGDLEVDNTNGSITLKNVSGSVVAHSMNGGITVNLDKVTADKPMSFTTLNGKIEVTIPSGTRARLRLKADNGEVFSDFDVKMEADTSKPVVEDSRRTGGKYRIRMDRGVYGSINGGGPEYRFETMNGAILIHKK